MQPFETHRIISGDSVPVPVFLGLVFAGDSDHNPLDTADGQCSCGRTEDRTAHCGSSAIGVRPPPHWTGDLSKPPPSFSLCVYDGSTTLISHMTTVSLKGLFQIQSGNLSAIEDHQLKPFGDLDLNRPSTLRLYSNCPVIRHIVEWIRTFSQKQNYKLIGVAIAGSKSDPAPAEHLKRTREAYCEALASCFWLELDAVPMLVDVVGDTPDEQASAAARKMASVFGPGTIPIHNPVISKQHNEVFVDCKRRLKLWNLNITRETARVFGASEQLKYLQHLCDRFQGRKMLFLSSTPQGGGVAIMRHALLRLLRLLRVQARWLVPRPNPSVFQITKKKFHNVLQGVVGHSPSAAEKSLQDGKDALPATVHGDEAYRLTAEDKELWEQWCLSNMQSYWIEPIQQADFVVVDDPQLCALIPHIRSLNPRCKIAFRSHIQIDIEAIEKERSVHEATWQYLWSFIGQADVFVFHPLLSMVPRCVPRAKTVFMPATTDPADGLNKPLGAWDANYYRRVFRRLMIDQHNGSDIDFSRHQYFIQIARFDPSKGIPDLIESFRIFSQKLTTSTLSPKSAQDTTVFGQSLQSGSQSLQSEVTKLLSGNAAVQTLQLLNQSAIDRHQVGENHPHLIICGHSAVDDPEGLSVYEETLQLLQSPKYDAIRPFTCVVRLPPSDQILNTLLRGACCVLQLSIREGFEIKITEALLKGIPVIACDVGGIPLQLVHGETGFLVQAGDHAQVAEHMYQLFTDAKLRSRMSAAAMAASLSGTDKTPMGEAIGWMNVIHQVLQNKQVNWDLAYVAANTELATE